MCVLTGLFSHPFTLPRSSSTFCQHSNWIAEWGIDASAVGVRGEETGLSKPPLFLLASIVSTVDVVVSVQRKKIST